MKKRILSLVLVLTMALSVCVGANAAKYEPKFTEEAEVLYELGLFKGVGTNADGSPVFALEQSATRMQGLVMLIRLLGEEEAALAFAGSCPFTDVPAWAAKYAAYAYDKGYTKGTSATTFGANDLLQGKAYVTFVLRALGYNDAAGDFSYNEALTLGSELGLVEAGACTGNIYRDDCAVISYQAMKTCMKDSDKRLADKLVADGVLTELDIQNSGIFSQKIMVAYDAAKCKITAAQIWEAFPDAVYAGGGGFFRDASFAQADLSPLMLLLNNRNVQAYCTGGEMRKMKDTSTVNLDFGKYVSAVTVLDKDLHLIGYCITPAAAPEKELEFKTCHLDGSKKIAEMKQKIAKLPGSVPKFDEGLVRCEVFVTSATTEYTIGFCPAMLHIDTEKLPESMQDFRYYSCYSGGELSLKNAWTHTNLHYLVDSKDYSTIVSYGTKTELRNVWIVNEGIVILYDANREPIGYAQFNKDMPMVETLVE